MICPLYGLALSSPVAREAYSKLLESVKCVFSVSGGGGVIGSLGCTVMRGVVGRDITLLYEDPRRFCRYLNRFNEAIAIKLRVVVRTGAREAHTVVPIVLPRPEEDAFEADIYTLPERGLTSFLVAVKPWIDGSPYFVAGMGGKISIAMSTRREDGMMCKVHPGSPLNPERDCYPIARLSLAMVNGSYKVTSINIDTGRFGKKKMEQGLIRCEASTGRGVLYYYDAVIEFSVMRSKLIGSSSRRPSLW